MKLLKHLFKKDNKVELDKLIASFKALRQKSDIAVLSPHPTGYAWLGVYNGGKSMFANNFISLSHYYSHSVFNDKELDILIKEITGLKFAQLLFNGFPPYFENFIQSIKEAQPQVKVGLIFHGFPAELSGNKTTLASMNGMVKLSKQKKLDKIGFAKKGFGQAFEKLFGVRSFELIYINPEPVKGIQKYNDGKLHVGVLVNNSFRKNLHTQVMAALMIENSVVHVSDASELGYLDAGNRIVAHGQLNHDTFIKTLGSMDLNFHVTFSEASGGQVCSESISQGVPCLSGYTSSFFDYNSELKNLFVVEGGDDPYFVYQKAVEVLTKKEVLSQKCLEYSAYLNTLAQERIQAFLAF